MKLTNTLLAAALSLGLSASAATFNVGDYDNCSAGDPGMLTGYLPVTADRYDYSFSQIIYTPNELNKLYNVTAEGIETADITEITFKLANDMGGMHEGGFSGTVYIQNYDGTTFPVVDNQAQWIVYDPACSGEFASDEYYYDTPDVIEVTAKLNTALRYEGGSLLLTFVADCSQMQELNGEGVIQHYVFKSEEPQAAVTAGDSVLDNLTGKADNVSSWIPVMQLGYTPVTEKSDIPAILFDNVTASLSRVTLAEGVQYGETEANALSISFDLVNAEETGEYAIKLGSTDAGTITGTHGVINFVAYPNDDLVLAVTPLSEDFIGSTATVTLDEVAALFPNPTVEYLESASFSEFEVISTKATIEGVAKFQFHTTAPVARMKGEGSVNQTKVVTSSTDLPECFASFCPAGYFNDYAANEGVISYYNSNLASADVVRGEFQTPSSKAAITVKFSMNYPLISATTPAVAAETATEVTDKEGYKYENITREYDNGSGFSYNKSSISVDVDLDNITLEEIYPGYLTKIETSGYISFYAPKGHIIHVSFIPAEQPAFAATYAAEGEEGEEGDGLNWVSTESNVYHHSTDVPGDLAIKTIREDDGKQMDIKGYTINDDGSTTGITSVAVGNSAPEYFDLAGRRVENPSAGVYIVRRGGKTFKVLVK